MHVISRKKLLEFSMVHPDAEKPLDVWYRGSKSAKWNNFADVKLIYSSADIVGKCTVFNIKENDYRLIAEINYRNQTIFVRYVLTHSEYDKGKWKL
ncbi:type II toxin-antitoxin system HigB family toxin [Gloeocapsopsis dulcis]|uniref:Addiction module toxin RelE n=1 Tax=Gloeocapsopsis dulcis AAB1 = 1H9 TaxID=1433147 RepID=A0A6N8FU91_9CHRO|nr:type II toxin-antitoxin system HigB family toxin [Gloeocapsopsis dulcis]MUL36429.1 hypothetical protein [Gloeocapsopsis dulcis AAB1 = 1H9]WNN88075.1 type II toxin-antitoxin system HigB family toxin [Gloeocapsopsis dulcis]